MALAKASSKNVKGKKKAPAKAAPVKAAKKSAPVAKVARKAAVKVATKGPISKTGNSKGSPAKSIAVKTSHAKAAPSKTVMVVPAKPAKTVEPAKVGKKAAAAAAMTGAKALAAYNRNKGVAADAARGLLVDGDTVCREVACENLSTTGGYCRAHYIKNWKKIKRKELILKEKKLNQYIEELVAKYPDKYIEAIRQDLANDKDFAKVIHDLDLDENVDDFDVEGESVESLIDNIKRDFEDGGDEGF